MHKLLLRQFQRFGATPTQAPPAWEDFVSAVDAAYTQADADRALAERALEITSQDMLKRYGQLQIDIAERRRAEAELASSEMRARSILEAIPDLVVRFRADGTVLDVRRGSSASGPGQAGESAGGELAQVVPACVLDPVRAQVDLGVAPRQIREFECQSPGGRESYEVRVSGLGGDEFLLLVREVTETRRLRDRVLVADRVASLSTLSAGVAHEINNPLTYVLCNVMYVLKEIRSLQRRTMTIPGSPDVSLLVEALEEAAGGVNRIQDIVRDLRAFVRTDGKQTSTDVIGAIETAIKLAWNQVRHSAQLIREFSEVPPAAGGEAQLAQVIVNLLLNAAQAVTEAPEGRRWIRVATRLAPDGRIVIEIHDGGMGIDSQVLPRIFDPFFTTKAVGSGMGLGLFISRGIVTSLGGEIDVVSRPDAGTTVSVALPAAQPVAASTPSAVVSEARTNRAARILLVDDEPLVAGSIRRLLEPPHRVWTAQRAREALDSLARGDSFDVILCDVMMPEMSGMDFHAAVGRHHPEMLARIAFLTGGAFTAQAESFLGSVPNPCLTKPLESDSLLGLVASMVG